MLTRLTFFALAAAALPAQTIAVRGLHLAAPRADEIPLAVKFIREALPKEGVNLLVLEINYRYKYTRRPEVAEPNGLSREDVKQLVEACRAARVRLIPQVNLLGHQSWSKTTATLLRAHPEFDETPGAYPNNEGIYCRSYCPLHPTVHEVVFDLVDEIVEVFEADAFHAGMDEVFLLGEDQCPRCRGKSKAELFAQEIRAIHDHLAASKRTLWLWADRFLDGETTGIGKWEASLNHTAPALKLLPNDIVMCDWHYETAHPTAPYFALEGFPVVSAPWRKASVALRQLDLIRAAKMGANAQVGDRMLGMLQTTWCGFDRFAKAYFNQDTSNRQALEAVNCFRELFRELRKMP
jgi:hypothetical protein